MTLFDVFIRLTFALVAGGLIGFERQWHHRMAGLRTNVLVTVGSSLYVLLSFLTINETSPTRIAAQIVSGIGFLGAGVIIRDGFNVRGLNTAATLWSSAAVGTLIGSGFIWQAMLGTLAIVSSNIALRPVANLINHYSYKFQSYQKAYTYVLSVVCLHADKEGEVRKQMLSLAAKYHYEVQSMINEKNASHIAIDMMIRVAKRDEQKIEEFALQLGEDEHIRRVGWRFSPEIDIELTE